MSRHVVKELICLVFCLLSVWFLLGATTALAKEAEYNAIPEKGIAKLMLDIQKLAVSGNVMQVGAHPDDEDNALMAYLAKGLHLNTYYLVSTFGEGGQNEIGPELYEALAVLRSQELASARTIDGAIQLYLGEADFGFSKSGAEALEKWDHNSALESMVRFLRTYRPEIVITHHDTVSGHGQHQATGQLILEAFDAAADPTQFPEQISSEGLLPWQVKKLYVSDSKSPTVSVNEGEYNPILGQSYAEIGALARSMHKCQGMGGPARKGDQIRSYKLVKSVIGYPRTESNVTSGLDFSLNAITGNLSEDPELLSAINYKIADLATLVDSIITSFKPDDPLAVADAVLAGLALVRELQKDVAQAQISATSKDLILSRLTAKEKDFVLVAQELFATSLDVAVSDTDVVPGQTFTVTVSFWNRGQQPIENVKFHLGLPDGWQVVEESPTIAQVNYNAKAEAKFNVKVAANAAYTDAFDPSPVKAIAQWQALGAELTTSTEATIRLLPAVAVSLTPEKLMVPVSDTELTRTVYVKLRNNTKSAISGTVWLNLPAGWELAASATDFAMKAEGEETSVPVTFTVPAGAQPGAYTIEAYADFDGQTSGIGYQVISYPHIETKYLLKPAQATAAVIDVKVAPGLKVGYVTSGFDNVPDYLQEMGVNVTLLSAEDLNAADLAAYDTIIVAIRAYLNRADLIANNSRLLEYVKNGGNLIVQYNKTGEWNPAYAPFPITVSSNRVTVEEAPITVLQPEHPFFNTPNKIGPADWEGWIQERGLYFPRAWDANYTALVATTDPNEDIPAGSWLTVNYGKGTYTYTALVWYRQLDALVPGGFRVMANMISLPKVK